MALPHSDTHFSWRTGRPVPKARYETEGSAIVAAREMSKRRHERMTHYGPCGRCGGWHIGTQPRRVKKRWDDVLLELGDRVLTDMRAENQEITKRRYKAVRNRGREALWEAVKVKRRREREEKVRDRARALEDTVEPHDQVSVSI